MLAIQIVLLLIVTRYVNIRDSFLYKETAINNVKKARLQFIVGNGYIKCRKVVSIAAIVLLKPHFV